jgi:hypothetical protein
MVKTVFKTGGAKKSGGNFTVAFKQGDYLFREGDLGTEMYIIQDGQVAILKEIDGEERELARLDKGDFFGEMSVLEDLPRTASAKAVVDSRLLEINGSTFDQMLRSNPEIAVRMMRKLARRLRETDKLLDEDKQMSVTGRAHEVPPPASGPIRVSASSERLIDLDSRDEFPLNAGEETLIGREDPVTGISPDVDLTVVDTQRSTSRRHAKILRKGVQLFVMEEIGTTNGTFINGDRAETGVPVELHAGDQVQFGLVKMVFRAD